MSATVETIYWRDIPAQVTARAGRDVHRVGLSDRFQEAIDRAATRTGLIGSDEYLAEWRKEKVEHPGDTEAAATECAAELEASFSPDVLERYVQNLAWKP